MAKQFDIETGTQKLATALERRQHAELSIQWRNLRNKLDSLLLSTNVMKTNEVKQACLKLDTMTTSERQEHIGKYWGPIYLERVDPLIMQIQFLETNIAKQNTDSMDEEESEKLDADVLKQISIKTGIPIENGVLQRIPEDGEYTITIDGKERIVTWDDGAMFSIQGVRSSQ